MLEYTDAQHRFPTLDNRPQYPPPLMSTPILRLFRIILLGFLSLFLIACGTSLDDKGTPLRHSSLLSLQSSDRYTLATLRNPWDTTTVLHRYVLVPRGQSLPDSLPEGTLLRTPLRRCALLSSVHANLALRLQADSCIAGLCDTDYVISPTLKSRNFRSYGSSMQPDVERMMADHVDALFVSPFENSGYGSIAQLGIPLIECADYMETSPLGRAEWMRFFGLLWGRGEQADSIFAEEERAYEALRTKVATRKMAKPRLLIDRKEGATWYVPGGESYLARLYADAGANYLFAHLKGAGSLALNLETVLLKASQADFWVVKYGAPTSLTLDALRREQAAYDAFPVVKSGRVFGCNTFQTPYYEDLPFSPSLLLQEWVKLLHPELLPDVKNQYYTPLK